MGSGGLAAPPTPQLVRPPPAAAVPLAPPIQVNYQPPVLSTVALRGKLLRCTSEVLVDWDSVPSLLGVVTCYTQRLLVM